MAMAMFCPDDDQHTQSLPTPGYRLFRSFADSFDGTVVQRHAALVPCFNRFNTRCSMAALAAIVSGSQSCRSGSVHPAVRPEYGHFTDVAVAANKNAPVRDDSGPVPRWTRTKMESSQS